jgi:hypothetical protein
VKYIIDDRRSDVDTGRDRVLNVTFTGDTPPDAPALVALAMPLNVEL